MDVPRKSSGEDKRDSRGVRIKREVAVERKLDIVSNEDAINKGWKIIVPFPDELVGKAIFEGEEVGKDGDKIKIKIMKSTKRIYVRGGWIYNTSTEYHKGNRVSVAEALIFCPL